MRYKMKSTFNKQQKLKEVLERCSILFKEVAYNENNERIVEDTKQHTVYQKTQIRWIALDVDDFEET